MYKIDGDTCVSELLNILKKTKKQKRSLGNVLT